jgi:hypothetical protein
MRVCQCFERRAEQSPEIFFLPPMRPQEHAVDLLQGNGCNLVPHTFEQRCDATISNATMDTLAGPNDQGQSLITERAMRESDAIEFVTDERFDSFAASLRSCADSSPPTYPTQGKARPIRVRG